METYHGRVCTPSDATILFEACRLGILPRVQRRLSEKERQNIRSGSVFVWDEREAGITRWTDGKTWTAGKRSSPSRISGRFLTYREIEGKRGGNSFVTSANRATKTPDGFAEDSARNGEREEGPGGYCYKADGLIKQLFSITTSESQRFHLISYYSPSHPTAQVLRQPSTDPALAHIQPAKGLYPESTINHRSSVPAVTTSPMEGVPSYVVSPSTPGYHRPSQGSPHPYLPRGYLPHGAYLYPISPMHTPPAYYALQPYGALAHGLPPIPHPPPGHYSPHVSRLHHAPPYAYDQRPLQTSESIPPPAVPMTTAQAPPAPYSISQSLPPPPGPQPPPFSPTQPPPPPALRGSERLQVNPRLTGSANVAEPQSSGISQNPEAPQSEPRPSGPATIKTGQAPTVNAGQAPTINASRVPTINALVHNISTLPLPPVETPQNEAELDRQGSTSPGGTKSGAPPQDILRENLGFREDKRALSKLD